MALKLTHAFLTGKKLSLLTSIFKFGCLFGVRLTWFASFSWLLVKLPLLKLLVGCEDVTAE